jgi:membrane-associated phospholipid phosphatase
MPKQIFILVLFLFTVTLHSQNIDIRILRSLNSPKDLSSDRFFKTISNTEGYLVVGLPVIVGLVGVGRHDDQLLRNACVSLAAVTIDAGITEALKYSINRKRPFITYPDIIKKSSGGSPSFPSGHTSSSFALATSLSLSYPKWYVIVPSYVWAGTVAYSRMDLGMHYPSDVLAGAVIGSGCAWLTHYVNNKLSRKPWEKPCNCPKF